MENSPGNNCFKHSLMCHTQLWYCFGRGFFVVLWKGGIPPSCRRPTFIEHETIVLAGSSLTVRRLLWTCREKTGYLKHLQYRRDSDWLDGPQPQTVLRNLVWYFLSSDLQKYKPRGPRRPRNRGVKELLN